MHHIINDTSYRHGALASLRGLIPSRHLSYAEALRIAELQANRLLELSGSREQPAGPEFIAELPRILVKYRTLPTSGLSYWDGQQWIVGINRDEPETRQRFTLLHEFKHIIDHGHTQQLYGGDSQRAEQAADYFAGCALMPKRLVKRAWGNGIQAIPDLAQAFDVSEPAIQVRLAQLGLTDPTQRCRRPIHRATPLSRGRYYRQLPTTPTMTHDLQEVPA